MGSELVRVENLTQSTLRITLETITERSGEKAREYAALLSSKAGKLAGKSIISPTEVAQLGGEYAALIGASAAYGVAQECVSALGRRFVDDTFGLAIRAIQDQRGASSDGQLGAIATIGASLEVISANLSGEALQHSVKRGSPKKERKTSPGSTASILERYIPEERCVADSEYLGYAPKSIVERFGYSTTNRISSVLGLIRRKTGIPIRVLRSDGKKFFYDLRGIGAGLIRCKGNDAAAVAHVEDDALKLLESVLEVEGVKDEYRKADARGILTTLKTSVKDLLDANGNYRAVRLSGRFVEAAKQYYLPN